MSSKLSSSITFMEGLDLTKGFGGEPNGSLTPTFTIVSDGIGVIGSKCYEPNVWA